MAASELHAGPMVQMIFARRLALLAETSERGKVPETRSVLPGFKILPVVAGDGYALTGVDTALSVNSLPSRERGYNIALNSAPTRITSEIMYIHTSSAMPTPSDP